MFSTISDVRLFRRFDLRYFTEKEGAAIVDELKFDGLYSVRKFIFDGTRLVTSGVFFAPSCSRFLSILILIRSGDRPVVAYPSLDGEPFQRPILGDDAPLCTIMTVPSP